MNTTGAIFASSPILVPELMKYHGVVAAAASDFTLVQIAPMATLFGVGATCTSFLMADRIHTAGPRSVALSVAGLGVLSAANTCIAVTNGWLWPLYANSFFIGGPQFSFAYTAMTSNMQRWFPDRRGLASSITLAGFGSGALVWAPIYTASLGFFRQTPTALGEAPTRTVDGVRYLDAAHPGTGAAEGSEVVYANASDLAQSGHAAAEAGLFLVGSGSTGYLETVASVAALTALVTVSSALLIRAPPSAAATATAAGTATTEGSSRGSVDAKPPPVPEGDALACVTSPQGVGLMVGTFGIGIASLTMIMNAKVILTDIWGPFADPMLLSAAPVAAYIGGLSLGSTCGRLGFAPLSDVIGRKGVYWMLGAQVGTFHIETRKNECACATPHPPTPRHAHRRTTHINASTHARMHACTHARMHAQLYPRQVPAIASLPILAAMAPGENPEQAMQMYMGATTVACLFYGGYTAMLPTVVRW